MVDIETPFVVSYFLHGNSCRQATSGGVRSAPAGLASRVQIPKCLSCDTISRHSTDVAEGSIPSKLVLR